MLGRLLAAWCLLLSDWGSTPAGWPAQAAWRVQAEAQRLSAGCQHDGLPAGGCAGTASYCGAAACGVRPRSAAGARVELLHQLRMYARCSREGLLWCVRLRLPWLHAGGGCPPAMLVWEAVWENQRPGCCSRPGARHDAPGPSESTTHSAHALGLPGCPGTLSSVRGRGGGVGGRALGAAQGLGVPCHDALGASETSCLRCGMMPHASTQTCA